MIWLISECHPLIGIYELDCREGGNLVVPLPLPRDTARDLCSPVLLDFSCNRRGYIFFFQATPIASAFRTRPSLVLSASPPFLYTLCIYLIHFHLFTQSSVVYNCNFDIYTIYLFSFRSTFKIRY